MKRQYFKVTKDIFGLCGGDIIIMSYDMVYAYYEKHIDKEKYPFSSMWLKDMANNGLIVEV